MLTGIMAQVSHRMPRSGKDKAAARKFEKKERARAGKEPAVAKDEGVKWGKGQYVIERLTEV